MLQVLFHKIFRGGRVVGKEIALTLLPGQLLWIKGENGTGKTTLLRTVAGFLPYEGECHIAPPSLPFSRAMAFLAHEDGLPEGLTVREELLFWADFFKVPLTMQDALKARYRLHPILHHLTQQLSAGQRRRIGLVRLLYAKAALWLLDEPFTHLDGAAQLLLEEDIAAHLKSGGSVMLTSHQPLTIPYDEEVTLAC